MNNESMLQNIDSKDRLYELLNEVIAELDKHIASYMKLGQLELRVIPTSREKHRDAVFGELVVFLLKHVSQKLGVRPREVRGLLGMALEYLDKNYLE